MSDLSDLHSATTNGVHALDKPVEKPKRQRQQRGIRAIAADSLQEIKHTYRVDTNPTRWNDLPLYCEFSLSRDGSQRCVKSSRSSYIDLNKSCTESSISYGDVFRIYR